MALQMMHPSPKPRYVIRDVQSLPVNIECVLKRWLGGRGFVLAAYEDRAIEPPSDCYAHFQWEGRLQICRYYDRPELGTSGFQIGRRFVSIGEIPEGTRVTFDLTTAS